MCTEGAAEKIDLVEDEADAERGNAVGGARAEPAGFLSSQWSMAGKIPVWGVCCVRTTKARFHKILRKYQMKDSSNRPCLLALRLDADA